MPRGVKRNSRIWLECAMPRDFRTYRPRFLSPEDSRLLTRSQESTTEEILDSVDSASALADVREVRSSVIFLSFKKSTKRDSIRFTSFMLPIKLNADAGSRMTAC